MEELQYIENPFRERTKEILDRMIEMFGWDFEADQKEWDETHSRMIKADEGLKKVVLRAKHEINAHDFGNRIVELHKMCDNQDSLFSAGLSDYLHIEGRFTPEKMQAQMDLMQLIADIQQLYEDWKEGEYIPLLDTLSDQGQLGQLDHVRTPPELLLAIDKLFRENKFKSYIYQDGPEQIQMSDKYFIGQEIGISQDLTVWFNHLKGQQEFIESRSKDEVFFTLFGQLDPIHELYSSWLITVHKGSKIWMVTDQHSFDNPYQQNVQLGRKSIWRERGELYYDCDLPYEIFHDLESVRKKQNSIVVKDSFQTTILKDSKEEHGSFSSDSNKRKKYCVDKFKEFLEKKGIEYSIAWVEGTDNFWGNPIMMMARLNGRTVAVWSSDSEGNNEEIVLYPQDEILKITLEDLKPEQRFFFQQICGKIISMLNLKEPEERICIAHEFVEQKLIEGAKIDPEKTKHLSHWDKHHQEYINDLIGEEGKMTEALTVQNYDLVLSQENYNRNWLTTLEKQESLAEWMIVEKDRQKLQTEINKLKDRAKEDYKTLWQMVQDNYDSILDKVSKYLGKNLILFGSNCRGFGNDDTHVRCGSIPVIERFKKGVDGWKYRNGLFTGADKNPESAWDYGWDVKPKCKVKGCKCNGNGVARELIWVNVRHWKVLCWLLDIKRDQLPLYYRNFRTHNFVPYGGNSILNQTHPLNRLTDPCSNENTNGMKVAVYCCNRYLNSLTAIEGYYSLDLNRTIEKEEMEGFNRRIGIFETYE